MVSLKQFDFFKKVIQKVIRLHKMSNLDYVTKYSFHHVICNQ